MSRYICSRSWVSVHAALRGHSLRSGTRPWPGRSSRWTLFPPAWISSIALVWVMPCVASPLISTIWSPTCEAETVKKLKGKQKQSQNNWEWAWRRHLVIVIQLLRLEQSRKTHVYPAVFQSWSLLSQAQDEQAHVVLLPSSQTEAEAPLAAVQLHCKTSLWFPDKSTAAKIKDAVLTLLITISIF